MNPTTTPQIETYRRIAVDGVGTLEGLLTLVGTIPADVPLDAEIVAAYNYEGCPPEAIEAEDPDDIIEHEHGMRIGLILEWQVTE